MKSNKKSDSSRESNRTGKPQSSDKKPSRARTTGSANRSDSRGPSKPVGRPRGLRMGTSKIDEGRNERPERSERPSREENRFERPTRGQSDEKPERYSPKPRTERSDSGYSRERNTDRPERTERPSRSRSDEKPERYSPKPRADRSDSGYSRDKNTDRPERTERPSRSRSDEKPERYSPKPRADRSDSGYSRDKNTDRPERTERPSRSRSDEKPERYSPKPRTERSDSGYSRERNTDRPERTERPSRSRSDEKPERSERPYKADISRAERTARPARPSRPTDDRKTGGKGPGGFGSKPRSTKSGDFKSRPAKDDFIKKNFKKPGGKSAEDLASLKGDVRLNRFLSVSGIASRREADQLIAMGLVTVNGQVITEMGHKVRQTDEVKYNGQRIRAEQKVYVLLNKPKGFITAVDDPKARKTVMDLLGGNVKERIYPVGRLDRSTTGVLLFTNDGDMAKKLTHPTQGARKIYLVTLDKPLTKGDLDKIAKGLELEDGIATVDAISYIEDKGKNNVGIELHIGKNRVVRRIFEHLGYEVTKLDRTSLAGLTKKNLNRGQWRYLTDKEVNFLKML